MSEHRELPDNPMLRELRSRFLNSLGKLRPRLHRFCARMCGSVLDGEDLVQETLAAASYKLSEGDPGFLDPSLFRMAYERCKYFIRLDLGPRERWVSFSGSLVDTLRSHPSWLTTPIDGAVESQVSLLNPYDRAVVVARDVLGMSIRETMELIGPSIGHVKHALARARVTLREVTPDTPPTPIDAGLRAMLQAYVDGFNRLDAAWFQRLVRHDARIEIVGAFSGQSRDLDSVYASTYAAMPWEWKQSVALVDGDPAVITHRRDGAQWQPYSAIRLWWEDGRVVRIRDYMHIRHILRDARIEPLTEPPESGNVAEEE